MCSVQVGSCVDMNWAILCHVLLYSLGTCTYTCVCLCLCAHMHTQVQSNNTVPKQPPLHIPPPSLQYFSVSSRH